MIRPILASVFVVGGCASASMVSTISPEPPTDVAPVGVLVMAHGGSQQWNEAVTRAVAPLAAGVPTAVAFGMANPITLRAGLDTLRSAGVKRVAVVRMFISGQSFLAQTEYLLGLSPTPPSQFIETVGVEDDHATPTVISHGLAVATHVEGLMSSPEAMRIIAARARDLSESPGEESVLLLAHGMGDEEENSHLLHAMNGIARKVLETGFHKVEAAALREDWAAERTLAERQIRSFVTSETDAGRRVIVVPLRLSGFGPYASVLAGLDYAPGEGLLPHSEVSDWLRLTAARVFCANAWGNPLSSFSASGSRPTCPG